MCRLLRAWGSGCQDTRHPRPEGLNKRRFLGEAQVLVLNAPQDLSQRLPGSGFVV